MTAPKILISSRPPPCSILIWPPLEKNAGSVPFGVSVVNLGLAVRRRFIVALDLFIVGCSGRMCGFPLGL